MHRGVRWAARVGLAATIIGALVVGAQVALQISHAAPSVRPARDAGVPGLVQSSVVTSWPTYMDNDAHTGFNGLERTITTASAHLLHAAWYVPSGAGISDQPVVAFNTIFWGTWDGYLHAATLSGHTLWRTGLGITANRSCYPPKAGVASTPSVDHWGTRQVVIVGGGDASVFALDAHTGHIIWQQRLGNSPSHFIWSSPIIWQGSVYIGIASFGDCPLVQGGLAKLNEYTGAVQGILYTVPDGCTGGSIWGTPTLDASSGIIYAGTGNAGTCSLPEYTAPALIAVDAQSMNLLDSWEVPTWEDGYDEDFGGTATLFTATIQGAATPMVGIASKTGWYFAFDRRYIGFGPIWQQRVANAGGDCAYCGEGSISSAAWDGTQLYIGGGQLNVNGHTCAGNLTALDPSSGAYRWRLCTALPVLGAISAAPGVVVVACARDVTVARASNGAVLHTISDTLHSSIFYSSANIIGGHIYIGNMDGVLWNFTV
jgi:polyvinyl alcohol dehydrogenase (cytochrome)